MDFANRIQAKNTTQKQVLSSSVLNVVHSAIYFVIIHEQRFLDSHFNREKLLIVVEIGSTILYNYTPVFTILYVTTYYTGFCGVYYTRIVHVN